MMGRPICPTPGFSVALQRPPQPKHRPPLPLQTPAHLAIGYIELQADHRHRPVVCEVRCLGLTPPPRPPTSPLVAVTSVGVAAIAAMKPSPTDINPLPHRWPNLLPLTGLTTSQVNTVCVLARSRVRRVLHGPGACLWRSGCWGADPSAHQPTTRALAARFHTSQSTVDRIIHHRVPILARALQPNPDRHDRPPIIDATLIPMQDQSITAISKNYRRTTQIIICARRRRVVPAGQCWPGNRNDSVARQPLPPTLTGTVSSLATADTAITSITTARRDKTGRIIRDDHYWLHRRIRARVEHAHRPAQRLANSAAMPPPRPRHQPQPPDHRRTLEPHNPQSITSQLFAPTSISSERA